MRSTDGNHDDPFDEGDLDHTREFDFGDDGTGWSRRRSCAVDIPAQIIHDDLRSLGGKSEGVASPDAAPCAGDDDDPVVANAHCADYAVSALIFS